MKKIQMMSGLAIFCISLTMAPVFAKPIDVRDLTRITRLGDPKFSPDGKSILLIETKPELEKDEFRSELMLVDVASGQIRPLTRERHHVHAPSWSPDGKMIGFIAPDSDKVPQLFIMPMAGGDALQITKGKDGIDQFAWSPDGKQIAYAVSDPKPELTGEDKFRTAFKVGNDDITISEAVRPTHVWLVSSDGGEPRRLTEGSWSLPSSLPPGPPSSPLKWSKDGKSLIIVRQETPSTGDQFKARIEILDIASGTLRPLTGDDTLEGYPHLSPDGKTIAYWRNRDGKPWNYQDLWIAPFAGGAGHDVSAKLDKNLFLSEWMPDGKSLLVGGNVDTRVGIWRLRPDGNFDEIDTGGIMPTNGYWMDVDIAHNGEIAFVGQTATDPFELYLLPAGGGAPKLLTHANAALSDITLGRNERFTWTGPNGQMLDGVVTYPADYVAGQKRPLVLVIHGGPNSSSRQRFGLLPQMMAAHGWIAFEPNYRGSDNRGNAFYSAIYGDAGQGPGEDVMSGIDALDKAGLIDRNRMAVTGWSYGGFMTTWLEGHYPVWKAAVAGAAVTDWVEMYDLSDGNVTITAQTGASPYLGDGMAINRRQSPDNRVTEIRTPTLILSNTGDFRVPIAQSFGLYRALRDNQVTTEFYAIPTGGHFPGDPIRQMDVYQRWVDWLVPYLSDK